MEGKPAPKISTEQLCRDYYDSQIFKTNGAFEIRICAEIQKADPTFCPTQKIDTVILLRELTALNIELFEFAWCAYNYQLWEGGKQNEEQGVDPTYAEIMFTKSYLEQIGEGDAWSAAGFYNDAIVQAAIAHENSKDWAQIRDRGYYLRDAPQFAKKEDDVALKAVREMLERPLGDNECASRLANRIWSVSAWNEGIMIHQRLSTTFAQRLNFNPNVDALLLLQRLTVGLYSHAKDYINDVVYYGSWDLARKTSNNDMKHIMRLVQKTLQDIERQGKAKE